MFKIFIVEDDKQLVTLLDEHLHKFGFDTQPVNQFDSILEQFDRYSPHLVLLDVNLPKYDGYYWCRQIRKVSTCPIIFISAREGKMDQVMALENGADNYITKPFDYDIAVAKINSLLHRADGELNKIVTQQLVLLFFVPIIVAIIHSIFAFMALQSFFTMSIATEMIIVLACFFIAQVIYFLFIRHHYLRNLKKTLI
jgi:CheY-like chemotaxis protein